MTTQDPKQTVGRFEVIESLGQTATGTVFRVRDPDSGNMHMVKVLDIGLIERAGGIESIREELETIQSLDHPNVGKILEIHLESDPVFIVSEYVQGVPLRQVLARRRLRFAEGFRVFRGVCEGLAAAHAQGLVHRDLNPKNVIVSHDLSVVKITDFGLGPLKDFAHEISHGDTGAIDTRTLKYLAPEFLRDSKGDERSDIYSAGVLCYEALTGRTPSGKYSLPSQLNSEAPSELDPIVLRCLSTDLGGRYTGAEELLHDIRELEERLRLGLAQNLKGFVADDGGLVGRRLRTFLIGLLFLLLVAFVFGLGWTRKNASKSIEGLQNSRATRQNVESGISSAPGTLPTATATARADGTPGTLDELRGDMVRHITEATVIPAAGTPPKRIEEFIGRVNSGDERLSVARMTSPPGWVEPGQRPEFAEFTVVLSGALRVETETGAVDVRAGEAVVAEAGEWVRYSTPEGAQYIAVCLPAFSLDTVHRDDEDGDDEDGGDDESPETSGDVAS